MYVNEKEPCLSVASEEPKKIFAKFRQITWLYTNYYEIKDRNVIWKFKEKFWLYTY